MYNQVENKFEYNDAIRVAREDFDKMLNLSTNSQEFKNLFKKYIEWEQDFYDPQHETFNNEMYTLNSNKFGIYSDEQLKYDPFGYYSLKKVGYEDKGYGSLFYEDFPMDNYKWGVGESRDIVIDPEQEKLLVEN